MIDSHELKNRDLYLNKLIGFQDTEAVKVITGIRRCGKSSLLKLMAAHLRETGVGQEQIVEMNFESHDFRVMSSEDIYRYVKERVIPGRRMYLFFDEIQRIDGFIMSTHPQEAQVFKACHGHFGPPWSKVWLYFSAIILMYVR